MRWHRIMNKGPYTCLSQMTLEIIAARMAYNEQMPNRINICWHKWEHQFRQSLQLVQIIMGDFLPPGVPLIEFYQLYPQKGSVKLVQARVETFEVIIVFFLRSIIAERAHTIGEFVAIGRYGAGVAKSAEVFRGIKTMSGGVTQRAGSPPLAARTLRLRRILNHFQSALTSDFHDWIHVRWLAVKMHGDDCFCASRQSRLDSVRIQIIGPGVRLGWNWSCTCVGNGQPCGNVRVTGNDDLITLTDSVTAEDEMQGIQTVPHADTVINAAIGRKFCLE